MAQWMQTFHTNPVKISFFVYHALVSWFLGKVHVTEALYAKKEIMTEYVWKVCKYSKNPFSVEFCPRNLPHYVKQH